jgi:phosphoribosyl 1,2-cyclic phosphodiesterase
LNIVNLGSSSKGNAFILESSGNRILLECGFPFRKLQEKAKFNLPDHCLLSHEHKDHSECARDYSRWCGKIYTSKGTAEKIEADCQIMSEKVLYEINGFLVFAFKTEHDCAEPFGYFIHDPKSNESLVFIMDSCFIRYNFKSVPFKLTHILIECNFDREAISPDCNDKHLERVFESHMSLQDLKLFLNANDLSNVEEINLCHLSNDNLDWHKAKKEIQELTGLPVNMFGHNGGKF